jgi:hypothetical protein
MRHHYLLAAIPVSFLAGLWLGHTLPAEHQSTAAPGNALVATQHYTQTSEKNTEQTDTQQPESMSARIDTIQSELRTIRFTLDQLSTSLHADTASVGNANTGSNVVRASYTPNEIANFQNNIFGQLSDPGFNLNKLNTMLDFQKLPEADKKLVIDEIARRLDSGEIKKSAFLPGYSPASK